MYFTHKVQIEYREAGNIIALDLGIVNIIAGLTTDGFSFTVPGQAGNYWHLIGIFIKRRLNAPNLQAGVVLN